MLASRTFIHVLRVPSPEPLEHFFEVDTLHDTLSSTIVSRTKKIFARYGSPMVCLTDNGPQFISTEYERFAKDWNFKHITSSPYHSQGNGRAEAAVKAVKNILRKCRIAAPPAHPTVIPTDIEVTTSATRYHPVPVPKPTTKPIDEAQANSQTDHKHVEPELATPTKDNSPHASPKIIRLPATSSKVNVSSPLQQQDTRRQFYTTRSGRESKPPKRYE